jgi:LMBR1-like membrane protein
MACCGADILCYSACHGSRAGILYSTPENTSLCVGDRYFLRVCVPVDLQATIGLFIPFSIVLLLPIDLASTTADTVCDTFPETCHRPWFYLSERSLLLCWRIGYWTTFALTWFLPDYPGSDIRVIFPILQSYTYSGHRSPKRRFTSALRQNLRYQAIVLGIFGLGLLYILLTVKISSFSDFQSLLIALAYTYGLLLTIICMGHGLVNIPRGMWTASSLDRELREIERAAVNAWETKADAEDQVALIAAEIGAWERACEGRDDPLATWIRQLALQNPNGGGEHVSTDGRSLDDDYLSGLTKRARKGHYKLLRAQTHWRWILRRAGQLYDLKSALETSGKKIDWKLSSPGHVGRLFPSRAQYFWYLNLLPWWKKSFAVFTACVSIIIVWSEVVHNWNHPVLSLVGIIMRSTGRNWFMLEVHPF